MKRTDPEYRQFLQSRFTNWGDNPPPPAPDPEPEPEPRTSTRFADLVELGRITKIDQPKPSEEPLE